MRAAIYARYSSDLQREASIADQCRNCARRAESEGLSLAATYRDDGISGSRTDRPGYQRLLADAPSDRWDVLLVEDLSRLSRDQVEAERTIRRLEYLGIRIIGVSDGYDSASKSRKVHRGVRNLLNEVYLDDLREKTHRGLEGQARTGFCTGGRAYGYRHIPIEDPSRTDHLGRAAVIGVRREPDPVQADIIQRIYIWFVHGKTARWIASELNRLRIPSPRGSTWAASAIYGHPKKGTGILRNELYAGRKIWNRSVWVKNPDTGIRERRERPESEWIVETDERLRIIDASLWERAQSRHHRIAERSARGRDSIGRKRSPGRHPRHLFSGLLVCGTCGGPMAMIDARRYGCTNFRNRGETVCAMGRSVSRTLLEERLLAGIREQLYTPQSIELFKRELACTLNARAREKDPQEVSLTQRLEEVDRRTTHLVEAIGNGLISPALQHALEAAETERASLAEALERFKQLSTLPQMLPRAEDIYASMIEQLEQSLRQDVDQAREILRQLVGAEIRLEPTEGGLTALVTSNYAGLLFARSGVASIDGSGGRILSLAVRIPLYVPRGGESIEPPVTIPDEQEWSALT